MIGYNTDIHHDSIITSVNNATAIGAYAQCWQSNTIILGSIHNINGAKNDVNVGIGTNSPKAKLEVANGDIAVTSIGKGIILKATNGENYYRITVDNTGKLSTELITNL